MKEKLPLALMIILGLLGASYRFTPHPDAQAFHSYMRDTLLRIVSAFALILGLGNLMLRHIAKIKHREQGWPHSWTLIISMTISAVIGLFGGVTGEGSLPTKIGTFSFNITDIYNYVITPLGATMFALLAFYMASAAYRSFRAKTWLAVLLLISAFIVMLGQVPLGYWISPLIPEFSQWIMEVPNTAAKRAIELGIALGVLATYLKIMVGIERGWLGSGR